MTSAKKALLSTSSLCVGFSNGAAPISLFKDLNVALHAGELVCLMGPNGVGKSTLIRSLARLQPPLSGSVTINGSANDDDWHYHLSVVLTEKLTAGSMTAHDVVRFGRYPYLGWSIKFSDADVFLTEQAIDRVGIREIIRKRISELSDGQLQMVMIARALAQDTPIILMDEPTAHLDLNNRVEMMKLLKSLTRELNKAILISTHELDLALQMADTIWLAGRNQELYFGLPEDLVLNESFDKIFRFKGFDLKTGRVQHDITHETSVFLSAKGHYLLWTKNALERNGFLVFTDEENHNRLGSVSVEVTEQNGKPLWKMTRPDRQYEFNTIADLVKHI
jgi:iron complex transport system ATP-binding protein